MLDTALSSMQTVARDLELAISDERNALAAVDAADETPDFAMREAELQHRSSNVVELAQRLLACPARGLPDILRKVRLLASIHPDGEGVAFVGGEEIGGVEPYDGVGLDILVLDAIVRDLQRLAA